MLSNRVGKTVHIGLLANEPIRLAGLFSIFEEPAQNGCPRLIPASGSLEQLLSSQALEYLLIDLHSSVAELEVLELIRQRRPDVRVIVIGPEGQDELVISVISAGARAYLDLTAEPKAIRDAIEVVAEGSIWAPRRLLSKLIDRLLHGRDTALSSPYLTARELQVLELILKARSNREIACQLGIEERTVKAHVGRLMRKTHVENRIELSMRALSLSMVPDPRSGKEMQSGTQKGIN